jgi:hypothetical protein
MIRIQGPSTLLRAVSVSNGFLVLRNRVEKAEKKISNVEQGISSYKGK